MPLGALPLPLVHALNERHLAHWLRSELEQLSKLDPNAPVALICRLPQSVRRLHRALYVAVTRTRRQLLLGAVAGQTPLLALNGLIR